MKNNEHSQHLIMHTVKDYGDRCNFERDVNDYLEDGYKVVDIKMSSNFDDYYHNSVCHVVVVVEKQNKLD
jgi:hypothetical protein